MHLPPFRPITLPSARILAVDCGASHVACAVFGRGNGRRLRLQQITGAACNPDPAAGTKWVEFAGAALAGIARREKIGGACRLALPGHHTLVKFVRTPAVERARRAHIVEFEAQQNIPCPLAGLVWDHLCVADDGAELELMLAAARRELVESVCAAAAVAGFAAGQVTPASLALLQAFRYNYPEPGEGALVISIGARSTHLVFVDGARFFARTVALGGNAITQAVADELRIEFAEAEALKLQVLTGPESAGENFSGPDTVRHAATRFTGRLQLEILRTLINYRHDGPRARPAVAYLAGGGSLVPGLAATLAEKLKLRVERYDPLRNVELTPLLRDMGPAAVARLAPELVGLAAGPGPGKQPACNLLPPALARTRSFRRRQPCLLTSAMLLVAALGLLLGHFQSRVTAAGANLTAVEQRLGPLRALVERNTGNLRRLASAGARLASLRKVVAMKTRWSDFLGDLQGRLVEVGDVWLEKLEVLPGPGEKGAAPAGPLRLALSGRLLDWNNPVSKVSADSYQRVKHLLQLFSQSEFVTTVEGEHFDNTQPGLLRFDCTLVLNPDKPL
jgi:type IV pilus assembly protein PilM